MVQKMRSTPESIQGLKDLIAELPDNMRMLEIGSYAGESTKLFLESGKVREMYCVDCWDLQPDEKVKDWYKNDIQEAELAFNEAIMGYSKVYKMKMTSDQAFDVLNVMKFDFVYIDADHKYESVSKDLLNWYLRSDIIGGHDYVDGEVNGEKFGVIRAVNELVKHPICERRSLKLFSDTSWLIK